jgi:carboxylesterase type B
MLPWQPVVDGDVIAARPLDRIAAGAGAGIDLMVGTNTDEHRMFLVPGGAIDQVTSRSPGRSRRGVRAPGRSDTGRLSRGTWGASAGDLLAAIQTD